MDFEEIFSGFLIALGAGALIGLQRQQSRGGEKGPGVGGVRTFPLIALAGALSAFLAQTMGMWPLLGTMLVVGAFLALSQYQESSRSADPGITTQVAGLITFLLGVLALAPDLPLAVGQRYLLIVASAGAVMALLSFKEPLHQAVARISDDDLYATAKFVVLTLVVLPLLPNRTYGPFNVLNPFNVALMVVLIAGMSFLGYIAMRLVGPRHGLLATGILGGVVSSTAVTVSLAMKAREAPSVVALAAVAALLASSTMFLRMLVVIGVVGPELLPRLVWPLGVMGIGGYGTALILYLKSRRTPQEAPPVAYQNPLELRTALQFGLFYAGVIVVAKGAQVMLGDRGLYASSVLAGTTDVDAITLSVVRFHQDGLDPGTAVSAIMAAVMMNTMVKAGLAAWFGGWDLGARVGLGLGLALAGGILTPFFRP
ncbi:MAG: MgtC/SapB family protein [Nitrospirota bacterium]|nr:MgtC/SapB family protein [Nitrospirota bacterium]MDP2381507.1 MgtC/SapB family protein [Nitrospirota bacterium]